MPQFLLFLPIFSRIFIEYLSICYIFGILLGQFSETLNHWLLVIFCQLNSCLARVSLHQAPYSKITEVAAVFSCLLLISKKMIIYCWSQPHFLLFFLFLFSPGTLNFLSSQTSSFVLFLSLWFSMFSDWNDLCPPSTLHLTHVYSPFRFSHQQPSLALQR